MAKQAMKVRDGATVILDPKTGKPVAEKPKEDKDNVSKK